MRSQRGNADLVATELQKGPDRTLAELGAFTGLDPDQVRSAVAYLNRKKLVDNPSRGVWRWVGENVEGPEADTSEPSVWSDEMEGGDDS